MKMPGYSAEVSLYNSSHPYTARLSYTPATTGFLVPAMHWGSITFNGCQSCHCANGMGTPGVADYNAILWDIPWGASWELACDSMPADFQDRYGQAHHFDRPTYCNNNGFNEWGHFFVTDQNCQCGQGYTVCTDNGAGGTCGVATVISCNPIPTSHCEWSNYPYGTCKADK